MKRQRIIADPTGRMGYILLNAMLTMLLGWLIFDLHPAITGTWGAAIGFAVTLLPESEERYEKRLEADRVRALVEAQDRREQAEADARTARDLAAQERETAKAELVRSLFEQGTMHVLERNIRHKISPR